MSPPNLTALQQLRRLDRSSPGFHDQLSNVLNSKQYERTVPNLQGDELVSLVDYLDQVCHPISPPPSLLKRTQALDVLDPASSGFRKCLRELRNTCSTEMILPTSYTPSSSLLKIGHHPVASGGPGDVYEGTLGGSRVCVKRVRVYSKDGPEKATRVRCPILLPTCSR